MSRSTSRPPPRPITPLTASLTQLENEDGNLLAVMTSFPHVRIWTGITMMMMMELERHRGRWSVVTVGKKRGLRGWRRRRVVLLGRE